MQKGLKYLNGSRKAEVRRELHNLHHLSVCGAGDTDCVVCR